jgi:hypothetical protein
MTFVKHDYEGKPSRYYIDGIRVSAARYENVTHSQRWSGLLDSFWTRQAKDGHWVHGMAGRRIGKEAVI